jgi:hypothetical protein
MAKGDMAATDGDGRPSTGYLIGAGLVAGGVLFGVWIALVGQADLQDNVAGVMVVATCLVAGWLVPVQDGRCPSSDERTWPGSPDSARRW